MNFKKAFNLLIAILIITSLLMLVIEILYPLTETQEAYFEHMDLLILIVFIADLIWEFNRIRNINKFIKTCWLEIIAIFPFSNVFRMAKLAKFVRLAEIAAKGSKSEKLLKLPHLIHIKDIKKKRKK